MMIVVDDFGMNEHINETVKELAYEGKIEAVSVFIDKTYLKQAISIISQTNIKHIGLHFNGTKNQIKEYKYETLQDAISDFSNQLSILKYELNLINRTVDFIDSHFNILNTKFKNRFDLISIFSIISKGILGYFVPFRTQHNSVELCHFEKANENIMFIYCHPVKNILELNKSEVLTFSSEKHINQKYMDYLFLKNGGYKK